MDFDLITKDAHRNLLVFCRELAGNLAGYKITEFRKVHVTMQFYCGYETPLSGIDHVRIDISPKELITAKPLESGTAVSEFTHASVSGIPVYSIEDLTARKMGALATRAEGKDLYDVHSALPLCSAKVLRSAIESMLKSERVDETIENFMARTSVRLSRSEPKRMRNLTNPFIPVAYRPRNWEELKNDLLAKIAAL
jgi:predicted nucleotidyltransferase component of viral defense system